MTQAEQIKLLREALIGERNASCRLCRDNFPKEGKFHIVDTIGSAQICEAHSACEALAATEAAPIKDVIGFGEKKDAELAAKIHYPQCWDTAAYPTLADAMYEIVGNAGCSEHPLPKHKNYGPARIG